MSKESEITTPDGSQRFHKEVKRRDFLGLAALGSFLVTGAVMVAGMLRLPMPSVFPETGSKFRLGPPDRFPPDSRTLVTERNVLVLRDAAGFAVMDLVCTHLGCITTRETDDSFTCPCHGSRFDAAGAVTQGPAPSALRYLEVTRAPSGVLIVDREKAVESSSRLKV